MAANNANTNSTDTNNSTAGINIAKGLAKIILASGLIGALIWYFGLDYLMALVLYICVPVLVILTALGFLKSGTTELVLRGGLVDRVNKYREELKNKEQQQEQTQQAPHPAC